MKAIEIKKDIYWVGVIDWNLRNFHGYRTGRGSSYNAYLIIDEKITLIDTAKESFKDELLDRISSIIDPAKIDYIICNHLEQDHSGSIPAVMEKCPHAEIYTCMPNGLKNIPKFYGDLNYKGVKAGDSLNIGKRTLQFLPVPMLHWPDSMFTYCPEEQILFSNDGFGQHLASSLRFDDEVDYSTLMYEAKKYYANILMLYGRQAETALKATANLDIKIIATGHGIIWRKYVKEIFANYTKWCTNDVEDEAIVVYDSMWHSTEKMAKFIVEGFAQKGIPAQLYDLKENHISDLVTEFLTRKYIAVGSPTLNNNMMPTVASFLCYLKGLSPKDKNRLAFAFGSYGWGGQSIAQVEEELKNCGFTIWLDNMRIKNIPTKDELLQISETILNK
ncbi:FprA family A-type flavoprotein [Pectinatus brassicae]|uniref:Flavorubredoxin n=1 Tax=Pectinatus brassicae TaxID=862415 RepID=A0A840UG15_9FIRM|nr:FprA family A-type flavoprotein [Pectinatus brassicae]MBB5336691.1 flavorubredoxin [Pectinatus brassicae]